MNVLLNLLSGFRVQTRYKTNVVNGTYSRPHHLQHVDVESPLCVYLMEVTHNSGGNIDALRVQILSLIIYSRLFPTVLCNIVANTHGEHIGFIQKREQIPLFKQHIYVQSSIHFIVFYQRPHKEYGCSTM